MRWAGHAEEMGALRNEYRIFAGEPDRKNPL
jgi:hypothetical protein